jgi:hypothetical protein
MAMNGEQIRLWNDAAMECFMVIPQKLCGETAESHDNPQTG